MSNGMVLWQPEDVGQNLVQVVEPKEIAEHAIQLNTRDRRQIVSAFNSGHYEMGLHFLWLKTISALKRELENVGIRLLGEMLGRTDVSEDDEIEDLLTTLETIHLSEELGVISQTDALRLRQTNEFINHFNNLGSSENEEIDKSEAVSSMKRCVIAVLARPQLTIATKFVEFRESLESENLANNQAKLDDLLASPYFFWKLTIEILMSSAKDSQGAKLEHCLANANALLPKLWPNLLEKEKWHVGKTYAEVYAAGRSTATAGLKKLLMKVQGFDFVPETLRSNTFIKAAEAVLRAHDGMNNFYNEVAPTRNLAQLGTSIPAPALPACLTALLSVVLGNQYGESWEAKPVAAKVLSNLSKDRWQYYLNQVLPSDHAILYKLANFDSPRSNWVQDIVKDYLLDVEVDNQTVSKLIEITNANHDYLIRRSAEKLLSNYYGSSRN